jgi:hypothetical protein
MAQSLDERPNTHSRAWEYWATRLAKRGEMPAAPGKVAPKAAPAKKKAAARPQTRKGRKRR